MRSTAEEKKQAIISELVDARRCLLAAAAAVPPDRQDTVFLGAWSVKDLLAHLAGWDAANLEAAQAVLRGQLPAFYACHDRDWRSFNARLVAEYRQDDFAALVICVQAAHSSLVDYVESIPPAEFHRDHNVRFRGYKVTVARLLAAEAGDERVHARQITDWQAGTQVDG